MYYNTEQDKDSTMTDYSKMWKNTDKEIEKANREAEEYAKELEEREVSDSFGMGVRDGEF